MLMGHICGIIQTDVYDFLTIWHFKKMWKTFIWDLEIILNHYHEIESVTQRCLALVHVCFPNVSIVHVPQSRKKISAYRRLNVVVCILRVSVKKSNFGYIQFKTKQFTTINTHALLRRTVAVCIMQYPSNI